RGLSASTLSIVHFVVNGVFDAAEKAEVIRESPMSKVKRPATPKPKPVAMSQEQARAFLEAASRRPEGLMFKLAFYTGARNCEWMGLQWRDVDWETGKLTIQRSLKRRREKGRYNEFYTEPPKSENGLRVIALTPDIIQGLRARRKAQKEEQMAARAEWSNP